MSLLTMAQSAALRLGLQVPVAVVASTEETAQRLYGLINQAGLEIMRRHEWKVLLKEKTFAATAGETQTGAIPSDFDRFVNGTIYNRTKKRAVVGPLTPQEWQVQKSLTSQVVVDAFRIRGSDMLIIPNPTASDTIAYEYVSKNWVDTDADGDGDATAFTADGYTSLLDEEMLTQDAVWRYRQSVGLNYAEAFRTAQLTILGRIAADGGRRTLDLGRPRSGIAAARAPYVPEGSWGV